MKGDGETAEHDGGNASDSSTAKASSGKGQLQPVGAFSYPLFHSPSLKLISSCYIYLGEGDSTKSNAFRWTLHS